MAVTIARVSELQHIEQLYKKTNLVTITGLGGTGKTALAQQFTDNIAQQVIWIDLEYQDDLIATVITALLDGDLQNGVSENNLASYFHDLDALIVLDNFEHLVADAVWLNRLLESSYTIRLLVTSRCPLQLRTEHLLPLEGLHYDSITSPAAQLLINQIQRVFPQFDIEANQTSILKICELTEGHPLALELIAGWARVISLDDILTQIHQNLATLTATSQDQKNRHQSIAHIISTTWQNLSDDAQHLLKTVSICQGYFSLDFITAMNYEMMSCLYALIDQSLIQHHEQGYRLHPLVKQFVIEKLTSTERETLEKHHAKYYLNWLSAHETELKTGDQKVALDRIMSRFENIQLAWMTAYRLGDYQALANSATALSLTVMMRHRQEGIHLFEQVMTNANIETLEEVLLLAHSILVKQWHQQLHLPSDTEKLQKALTKAESWQILDVQALIWRCLGHIAFLSGEYKQARAYWQRGSTIYRQLNDRYQLVQLMRLQGHVERSERNLDAAHYKYLKSYQIGSTIGDDEGAAGALMGLGDVATSKHQYAQAVRYYGQAFDIQQSMGNWGRYLYSAQNLMSLHLLMGNDDALQQIDTIVRQQTAHLPPNVQDKRILYPLILHTILNKNYAEATTKLTKIDPLQRYAELWSLIALGQGKLSDARVYLRTYAYETTKTLKPLQMLICLYIATRIEDHSTWWQTVVTYSNKVPNFWLSRMLISESPSVEALTPPSANLNLETAFEAMLKFYQLDTSELLTTREAEIIHAVALGLQNKEIASQLGIATGTVKQHLNNIYRKLGVSNRVEAISHERVLPLL